MVSSIENIVKELDMLIESIRTEIPDVPGKDRLLRGCFKERSNFDGLSKVPLRNAEDTDNPQIKCSNVPHFKAIHRLAYAYRHRLVGLLSRYRMPPRDVQPSVAHDVSSCSSSSPDCESGDDEESMLSELNTFSLHNSQYRKKTGYIVVDLVCLQDETRQRADASRCPGNAPDADLWAPILWIKAVNRDANRLNLTWRGESLCSRTSCLSTQAREMVSTAAWYQRDQCSLHPGITVVFHWLPSTADASISSLDPGLVDTLARLKVTLATGSSAWSESHPVDLDDNATPSVAAKCIKHQPALSLKRFQLHNEELQHILLKPVVDEFREHKFAVLASLLEYFDGKRVHDHELPEQPSAAETSRRSSRTSGDPLEVVLRRSIVYPYASTVWDKLDRLPHVNLDTSALISMTTEIAQFLPSAGEAIDTDSPLETGDEHVMTLLSCDSRRNQLLSMPPFKCSKLDWIREAEAEKAVLLSIGSYTKDCVLLVCQTAVTSFIGIMAYVAGPSEWFRGVHLISRLAVVADSAIESKLDADATSTETSDKPSIIRRSNRQKTKHIVDVGNAFNAMTMTSNSAYLRSLRQSGRRCAAILIPARALTEEGRHGRA